MMQNMLPRWRAWGELLYSVQTGESAFEHVHGMSNWEYYASDPDILDQFNEGMAELTQQTAPGIVAAYDFSEAQTVVDVGGGRGHLMMNILSQYPSLRGVIVEVPALVEEDGKSWKRQVLPIVVTISPGTISRPAPGRRCTFSKVSSMG